MSNLAAENNFVLNLEENAIDSLVHAVEHFVDEDRETNLKYAILHTFHAVELFLKARLAKIDPSFIFEGKRRKDGSQHTVGFVDAIKKLEQEGVVISKTDNNDLSDLQKVRNNLEHHQFSGNRQQVEAYVGKAVYFLETFIEEELGINLKEKIDEAESRDQWIDGPGIYAALSKAQFFHIKKMSKSGISLNPKYKGIDGTDFLSCELCCESCEEESIVIPDPTTDDDSVHCFICQTRYSYSTKYCLSCGDVMHSLFPILGNEKFVADISDDENKYTICDVCLENNNDSYWVDDDDD